MKSHHLYNLATIFLFNLYIRADLPYNPFRKCIFNRRHYLYDVIHEEVLFGTENHIFIANEEDNISSVFVPNETDLDDNSENEASNAEDKILNKFYDNVVMMFLLIKTDDGYFEHTSCFFHAFYKIEKRLPDITDEYNRDLYIKYLKICYKSIYHFIIFLGDEKKYATRDIYQKTFDKIQNKLKNIDEFIDLHSRYFDKIGLHLNFFELSDFKDDVIYFKKLIDQEVEHFKCYNDFRQEKFINNASSTKSKILEFLDIFRSTVNKIKKMREADFKDIKNPLNDEYIEKITGVFKGIFINVKNYEKLISNYFDSLINIAKFEFRYIVRLKTIIDKFDS
jgi:hypothetical protein